jgi:hypothetical protein
MMCVALRKRREYATSRFVFAIEANGNQVRVVTMAKRIMTFEPLAIIMAEVTSQPRTLGVWTYDKEQHRARLSAVLADDLLCIDHGVYAYTGLLLFRVRDQLNVEQEINCTS